MFGVAAQDVVDDDVLLEERNVDELAAHAAGLGSLWFTFYDKNEIQKILGAEGGREVIALVCLGQANGEPAPVPRKSFKDKTTYIS